MTKSEILEIKEKLDLILDALGLGGKSVITTSQAKEEAQKMVLQFRKKSHTVGHEREKGI